MEDIGGFLVCFCLWSCLSVLFAIMIISYNRNFVVSCCLVFSILASVYFCFFSHFCGIIVLTMLKPGIELLSYDDQPKRKEQFHQIPSYKKTRRCWQYVYHDLCPIAKSYGWKSHISKNFPFSCRFSIIVSVSFEIPFCVGIHFILISPFHIHS